VGGADQRLRGPARDIQAGTFSVLGVQIQPGSSTEFRDRNDAPITQAAFFEQLSVGTAVQVRRGTFTEPPPRIDDPTRVELED
jgi:hypothetical protein